MLIFVWHWYNLFCVEYDIKNQIWTWQLNLSLSYMPSTIYVGVYDWHCRSLSVRIQSITSNVQQAWQEEGFSQSVLTLTISGLTAGSSQVNFVDVRQCSLHAMVRVVVVVYHILSPWSLSLAVTSEVNICSDIGSTQFNICATYEVN